MKANEILFRGEDVKQKGHLIYFSLADVVHGYKDGSCMIMKLIGDTYCADDEVENIQPCIRLKDINGKLIYEGDLLKNDEKPDYLYRVRFVEENGCYYLGSNMRFRGSIPLTEFQVNSLKLRIMGNMTETPELWKGGDE